MEMMEDNRFFVVTAAQLEEYVLRMGEKARDSKKGEKRRYVALEYVSFFRYTTDKPLYLFLCMVPCRPNEIQEREKYICSHKQVTPHRGRKKTRMTSRPDPFLFSYFPE